MAHTSMRLIVAGLVLAAIGAEPAGAGTFHVYGLGLNGGGCPSGWHAQGDPLKRFHHTNHCSRWRIRSRRDGRSLKRGDWVGTSMVAGRGARFTGFSLKSHGTARNGTSWTVAMCATPFRRCRTHSARSGTWDAAEVRLGSLTPAGSAIHAQHLWAGAKCTKPSCADSTSAGRAINVTHLHSHAVVDDYTPPAAPSLRGVSTGWNSGPKELSYSASDAGGGIESVTLAVDQSPHRTVRHSCARLPRGGYAKPVPCATATGGEFTLNNEAGQLADGRHSLTVGARDAGGTWAATTQEFWVDNNPPKQPISLDVAGGDGWRGENAFSVAWENPDQGSGSEIAGAYYKVGSAPETATDGTFVAGSGIASLSRLRAPEDGEWDVHVWLRDEAGNARASDASVTRVRFDSTAPSLAFLNERAPGNEVRVRTSDRHSGLAGGRIDIRRRGVAEWQPLETRREGTELVAEVPDDRLERGTHELRATAWDAAGNSATTSVRADGQQMVLDLPLRGNTTVSAHLSRRAGGTHRSGRSIRVGYRKRVWLRGVLRSGGARLPDTRLVVETRQRGRSGWRPLTELVTGGNGRYAARLPRGPSREVRVRFPGSRLLQPATDVANLQVRGWASLELRPRRLRRGGRITFRGRVGLFGASPPAVGKLIQIQYLDGRRWRPAVKLGHTDRRGRFAIRYRFRRISRPTRIYFRIMVPAEGGWPYATGASKVRTAFVKP